MIPRASSRTSFSRSKNPPSAVGTCYVESRPPHRRPPRGKRTGDHHRCRVPLFRHAEAEVHHRGHAGPYSIHPQHGHRRFDRRSCDHPRGCTPGRDGTDAPSCLHRLVVAYPAPRARRHQADLVDFSESVFNKHRRRLHRTFPRASPIPSSATAIPLSALRGDNVVDRSDAMPWYDGPAFFCSILEIVNVHARSNHSRCPLPRPVGHSSAVG